MSKGINNQTKRKEALKQMIRQLHEGRTVDEVKEEFADLLEDVGATEVAELEQALIDEGLPETEVKRLCDVHAAVFRESLEAQAPPQSLPGHPVHTFRAENEAAAKVLDQLEVNLESVKSEPTSEHLDEARAQLAKLREYERHYLRKENILFPILERHGFAGPSSVMWAIHDDVRDGWKALDALLEEGPNGDAAAFRRRVEEIFEPLATAIREMFYKEENILFPTALEKLDAEEWAAIRAQGPELGYSYVEPGDQWTPDVSPEVVSVPTIAADTGEGIPLDTGALKVEQINLLLNHLPIEITFVGTDDTVRFFTQEGERIFPRTAAIIGRKVQKCHPPDSVDRVQQILDDFRAGARDVAEFWIQMEGRFIHIRYFAVRDAEGAYEGTLEVVQDVTKIRQLEGERRLLDEEPS